MDEKVSQDDPSPTRTEEEGATVDAPSDEGAFVPGTDLGGRYHIRSKIGAGGMGEVWRAFDVKLRVDVALKALRSDLLVDQHRLELLRREVRAAREVVSPNVCRIFDLIEAEGRELVSMEYIDGQTLLEVLNKRGPLELMEAQDIASQFLAGLEAIHGSGLVHRDVKPENIMLTRAGRVVVMDFGLARQETEGVASVSGTPAYMAPEHAAGQTVDARADVYSAGVVLAEMVSPGGIKEMESRKSLWEGVRSEPPQLPDSPWAPVIKRAVAKQRDQRYNSAHTLTRALEDVTQRVAGAEDVTPYPGLSSFTEDDAEFFFGRETEVEGFWTKLNRPHLLAIVGSSGAGKTSFINAGVLPAAPDDWARIVCTPGNAAIASLARPMARELAGNAELMEQLLSFDDPDVAVDIYTRWRKKHPQALLVVDQFEELFTLNPPEHQARFSELLGRLVLEADVCVVLSMRDDFLMRCRDLEALRPIFSELTALPSLTGSALRRALVQPATKCGYRFEDDELVEEMLAEVEGERGALPTLAFAAARLWEKRDRDNGLLTRQAYQDIGGVGGALARHAEATIDRIGLDRVPIVRELFRNLVTGEGTRAVREWDELLSVFDGGGGEGVKLSPTKQPDSTVGAGLTPARAAASEVLSELIDARLLTSYDVKADDEAPTRRVEIIHESLLANWPRLVRWQTQDSDAVQLRDQLRQAARTWQEHERSDDLLWTGSAYREFAVWRERYPGGLTENEEAFGEAMTRHAERRRRRRRIVVAASFGALLAVLAIVGGFWRRSVSEAQRAEAANLYSLAQFRVWGQHSHALAYAIASLELADSPEVRRLALAALWQGPTYFVLPASSPSGVDFSPDGRWLATASGEDGSALWPSDGGPPTPLEASGIGMEARISPRGDLVAANMDKERRKLGLWTVPEGRFVRSFDLGGEGLTAFFQFSRDGERLFTSTETLAEGQTGMELEVRSWPVGGGDPVLLAHLERPASTSMAGFNVGSTESRLVWADGTRVWIAPLGASTADLESATSVEHDHTIGFHAFDRQGRQLATGDTDGWLRIWSLEGDRPELSHTLRGAGRSAAASMLNFDSSGSKIFGMEGLLWDLTAPPDAEPLRLSADESGWGSMFHPDGDWLVLGGWKSVVFWPLSHSYPLVFRGHEARIYALAFTPDGRQLVSCSDDGTVRLWSLGDSTAERSRVLETTEGVWAAPTGLVMAPDGSFVATENRQGRVAVVPLAGGPVRELVGFTDDISGLAVGPQSRLVAAGAGGYESEEALVRVWNLESGEVRILDAGDGVEAGRLEFTGDGDLWVESGPKLRRWDLDGGEIRVVEEIDLSSAEFESEDLRQLDPDRRQVLLRDDGGLWIHDLDTHESRGLSSHAGSERSLLNPTAEIVVSKDASGALRVGPETGEEPHLLLGHGGGSITFAVSPDGRRIASGDRDAAIRLWPMPDLSRPPLHTLSHDELIAKLKTLTNLRAVRDEDSTTGWKIEAGPFPGWETVPTW